MTQLHLANLGRATRTTIHCTTCQMQYNKIDPHDQKLHSQHHTSIVNGPLFWKSPVPTALSYYTMNPGLKGTFLLITRSSGKIHQVNALKLLKTIDIALGAPRNVNRSQFFPRGGKIFGLVSDEGRIISLVAAERIEYAYRRIASGGDNSGVETAGEKEKAVMGISRMWTCISERGKGYCKALLEESLYGFIWAVKVTKDQVAFSTPSESGMEGARRWSGREDFLVYDD